MVQMTDVLHRTNGTTDCTKSSFIFQLNKARGRESSSLLHLTLVLRIRSDSVSESLSQ